MTAKTSMPNPFDDLEDAIVGGSMRDFRIHLHRSIKASEALADIVWPEKALFLVVKAHLNRTTRGRQHQRAMFDGLMGCAIPPRPDLDPHLLSHAVRTKSPLAVQLHQAGFSFDEDNQIDKDHLVDLMAKGQADIPSLLMPDLLAEPACCDRLFKGMFDLSGYFTNNILGNEAAMQTMLSMPVCEDIQRVCARRMFPVFPEEGRGGVWWPSTCGLTIQGGHLMPGIGMLVAAGWIDSAAMADAQADLRQSHGNCDLSSFEPFLCAVAQFALDIGTAKPTDTPKPSARL